MTSSDPFHASPDELRRRAGVKWNLHPADVLGAFVAEADFGTAPTVTTALHDAVTLGQLNYLSDPLADELGRACSDWYATATGWRPDPAWIHPIADVVRGLEVALASYSRPGSAMILPTPAYMPFFDLPDELGRALITVPMLERDGRYEFDLPAIAAAFEAGGGLLVLVNPCNPVGRVFEREELAALAEVVERAGGRVFVDEIHAPLVFAPHRHVPYASVSAAAAGHSVTTISASKAWNLPGLKCASMVLTNEADAANWSNVGLLPVHGASTLGVIANTAAYREGAPWLADVVAHLDRQRTRLAELLQRRLPSVRYRVPEGTYLAWLDVRPLGLGDAPAAFFLERARVAVTEGALCGAPGFIRLNLATSEALLDEIIDRLASSIGL